MKRDSDIIDVIFRKHRDGEVIAFFPNDVFGNGMILSYSHNGQHSEASLEFYGECKPCRDKEEYKDLFHELARNYGCFLRIRQRLSRYRK